MFFWLFIFEKAQGMEDRETKILINSPQTSNAKKDTNRVQESKKTPFLDTNLVIQFACLLQE